MKCYYTIIRKYYGFSSEYDTDLSTVDFLNFSFDTLKDAELCLKLLFNNGEWMNDLRYGKIRHYVAMKLE
nr:MAG TPA: hypothetical protein [Caudoviricetes sp.]